MYNYNTLRTHYHLQQMFISDYYLRTKVQAAQTQFRTEIDKIKLTKKQEKVCKIYIS